MPSEAASLLRTGLALSACACALLSARPASPLAAAPLPTSAVRPATPIVTPRPSTAPARPPHVGLLSASVVPAPTLAGPPTPSVPLAQVRPEQETLETRIAGRELSFALVRHEAYPAVDASELAGIWEDVRRSGIFLQARLGDDELALEAGSPFFRRGDRIFQLANPPYARGGTFWLPAEFITRGMADPVSVAAAGSGSATEGGPEAGGGSAAGGGPPVGDGSAAGDGSATGASDAGNRSAAEGGSGLAGGSAAGGRASRGSVPPAPAVQPLPDRVDPAIPWNVIIDPGHGGRDPGAVGRQSHEKDVVLEIALRLAEEIRDRDMLVPHLTRDGDTYVEHHARSQFAVDRAGDLFISIHANAAADGDVRGFETIFLGTARTDEARDVALRENRGPEAEGGPTPPSDIQFILTSQDRTANLDESRLFAGSIQNSIRAAMRGRSPDRGVIQGPWWVLLGALARMPSVIVEVGFLSNREEEAYLNEAEGQAALARAIAHAVESYRESVLSRYAPEP